MSQTFTYNRFKDTKIYGTLKNSDNGSTLASATFDRTLQVGTNLTVVGSASVGSLSVNGANVVIGDYLKTVDAQNTYQPVSQMSNYVTTSNLTTNYYTKTNIDQSLTSNSAQDRAYTDSSVSTLKTYTDGSLNSLSTSLTQAIASNSINDRAYSDSSITSLKTNYIDPGINTLSARVDSSYNTLNSALNTYIQGANSAAQNYASLTGDLALTQKLSVVGDCSFNANLTVGGDIIVGGQMIQQSLSSLSDALTTVQAAVTTNLTEYAKLSDNNQFTGNNNFSGMANGFNKITLQTPPVFTYASIPSSLQSNQQCCPSFVSRTSSLSLSSNNMSNLCNQMLSPGYYIITFIVEITVASPIGNIDKAIFGLGGSTNSLPFATGSIYADGVVSLPLIKQLNASNDILRSQGTWVGAYNNFNSNGQVYLNLLPVFSGSSMSCTYANMNAVRIG